MRFQILAFSLMLGLCSVHTAEAATTKSVTKKTKSKITVLHSKAAKKKKAVAKKRFVTPFRNSHFTRPLNNAPSQDIEPQDEQDLFDNQSPLERCDNFSGSRSVDNVVLVQRFREVNPFEIYDTYERDEDDMRAEVSSKGCTGGIDASDLDQLCKQRPGCNGVTLHGAGCSIVNLSSVFGGGGVFVNYLARPYISFTCVDRGF